MIHRPEPLPITGSVAALINTGVPESEGLVPPSPVYLLRGAKAPLRTDSWWSLSQSLHRTMTGMQSCIGSRMAFAEVVMRQ